MQNTDTKEVDAQYRQRIGKCRMQTTQGKCTNVQYKNTEVNVQWRQRIGKCSRQTKQYRERIGKCRIQQQQQQKYRKMQNTDTKELNV